MGHYRNLSHASRMGSGRLHLRALATLVVLVAVCLGGAGSALAGPTFGPYGVNSSSFACGGGGAVGAGGYRTNWTSDATAGSNCHWDTGSMGSGTRVSTLSFDWSTGNGIYGASNSNGRYVQFGVQGGSGMTSILWGASGAGHYAFDVSGQGVGAAATNHIRSNTSPGYGANPAGNAGFTQTSNLQYVYEDLTPPTVAWMNAYPATSYGGWWTGAVYVDFQTYDNAYFNSSTDVWVDNGQSASFDGSCAPYQPGACYTTLYGLGLDPGPDGYKNVWVRRNSGGGWGAHAVPVGFWLDRNAPTAPGLSAAGFTSGDWTNQDVTVSITTPSTDGTGSGVQGYQWSSGQTGTSATYSAEGSYFVQATANDGAGHSSTSWPSFVVQIDKTAPPAPALTGAPSGGAWSNATNGVPLTIQPVTDVGAPASAGVDSSSGYQYRFRTSTDGVTYSGWSQWTTATGFTVATDGWTEVVARAVDRAGNVSSPGVSQIVKLDRSTPLTGNVSADEDWHCAVSQTVTGPEASDPGPDSGLSVQFRTKAPGASSFSAWQNGTSVTVSDEGETTVQFRALDGAGNASDPITKTVRLDCGIPSDVTITGGDLAWKSVASMTLTASATDAVSGVDHYLWERSTDGGATWVSITSTNASQIFSDEGETLLRAKAVDRAGNVSANWSPAGHRSDPIEPNGGATVRLDRVAPQTPEVESLYRAEGADGTVTDQVGGPDSGWHRVGLDQPLRPDQDGEPHAPRVDFGPITVRLVSAPVDVTSGLHPGQPYDVAQPSSETCPGASDAGWTAWGDLAQLPHIDKGEQEGKFLVCFRARDAAGNLSEVASGWIKADKTSPEKLPDVTAPPPGWHQGRSAKVDMSVTPGSGCEMAEDNTCNVTPQSLDQVSRIVGFEYQLITNGRKGEPTAIAADALTAHVLLTAGEWEVRARSLDAAGNRSQWSGNASVDLAEANQTLVRSWGLGSLESALCRLPSLDGTVDLDDCGQTLGGPDWNTRHIWVKPTTAGN